MIEIRNTQEPVKKKKPSRRFVIWIMIVSFLVFLFGLGVSYTIRGMFVTCDNLTDSQIEEVTDKFKFDLSVNKTETIRTLYSRGHQTTPTILQVYVDNIDSEEGFMSRFRGESTKIEKDYISGGYIRFKYDYDDENVSGLYEVEIFEKKADKAQLVFYSEDGKLNAMFFIAGNGIGELENICKYNALPYYLLNPYIIVPTIVFVICAVYLIRKGYK